MFSSGEFGAVLRADELAPDCIELQLVHHLSLGLLYPDVCLPCLVRRRSCAQKAALAPCGAYGGWFWMGRPVASHRRSTCGHLPSSLGVAFDDARLEPAVSPRSCPI